jgi:hypothetical protein
MMINRIAGIIVIIMVVSFALSNPVQAHVLITNDAKSVGAVLHIVPDDDPVAGKEAQLYFDIQSENKTIKNAQLTIMNPTTSSKNDVPVVIEGSTVTSTYIFPTQGLYELRLNTESEGKNTFTYSQRVSRGVADGGVEQSTNTLASIALISSSILLLVVLILVFNNRKAIKKQSTL